MLHGSYGTLAILTRITFELVESKPFVALEYRHHRDFSAFAADLRDCCAAGDFDFVDGIVHTPDHLVLCCGRFTGDAPRLSAYRAEGPYYRSTARLHRDWMTTYDYLFRYDPDCHWLSRTFPPLEWPTVRRALGRWFLGSENLIRWSGRLSRTLSLVTRRPDVVVDVFIPLPRFAEFWDWYARELDYWPLWIVPYRVDEPYPWIESSRAGGIAGELMIDCAVYGKRNNARAVDWSQALEAKTYELGGIKTLISRNHHTREQFWAVYDRERWSAAKDELDPGGAFADLYDKFHG
jgi:FAD/FMN-containing dehydrogenase